VHASAVVVLLLLASTMAAGCSAPTLAEEYAGHIADQRFTGFSQAARTRDVDRALWALSGQERSAGDSSSWRTEVLEFSGALDEKANLVAIVRISVSVRDEGDSGLLPGRRGGSGSWCYAFETDPWGQGGATQHTCPDGPALALRSPAPRAVVDESTREMVLAWLRRGTPSEKTPESLGRLLSAQLNGRTAIEGTRVGVAVVAWDTNDCLLALRDGDGTVSEVHVAPVHLQPGEDGCDPWLALHPVPAPH
jgi:hypothetical protein